MERINSLSDLLMVELADLLNAENQLIEALPKMTEASRSPALKAALTDFLEISRGHISRLQGIFDNAGQRPKVEDCRPMKDLIQEGEQAVHRAEKDPDRDTAIISAVQGIEGFEIAGYATAREHAVNLGHTKIVEILDKTLNEGRAVNLNLSELAQGIINVQATDPQSSQAQKKPFPEKEGWGFYVPEGRFKRTGVKKKPKNPDISRYIDEGNPNTQDP